MTIEKLQKVATAAVEPQFKAKWLHWWNAGSILRTSVRFPDGDVKEIHLDSWLNKASFWAQVRSSSISQSFSSSIFCFLFALIPFNFFVSPVGR